MSILGYPAGTIYIGITRQQLSTVQVPPSGLHQLMRRCFFYALVGGNEALVDKAGLGVRSPP